MEDYGVIEWIVMEAGVSLKGFNIISCERANYNSLIVKDLTWYPDR